MTEQTEVTTTTPAPNPVQRRLFDAVLITDALEKLKREGRYDVAVGGASFDERVALLEAYFKKVEQETPGKILDCDKCGAMGSDEFDACPFCGNAESEAPAAPKAGEIVDDDPFGLSAPADAAPQGQTAEPEGGKRKGGQKLVKVAGKGKKAAPAAAAPSTAIEKAPNGKGEAHEGVVEIRLDREVAEVKRLHLVASTGGWILARKLREIEETGLWKTRVNSFGQPVHKNWNAFVAQELKFGRKYAQDLLRISAMFNEKEYNELGPTKARLIVQMDTDAKRAKLLKMAKGGASRRQLEKEAGRKRDSVRDEEGRVTVAMLSGKKRFTFVTKETAKDAEPKPAKRLADVPWARVPIAVNDVEVLITLLPSKNGGWIEGVVEVRRVEPGKAKAKEPKK